MREAGGGAATGWPLALVVLTLTTLAAFAYWYGLGRPVALAELPQANGDGIRLQCVSYAPFRRPGESPFNLGTRISPERIETDLKLLAKVAECVRIYSVQQGLEVVPEIARRLGLKVLLGVWIGRNRLENDAEMKLGIELTRKNADVVAAMIVGNEVLLRRELPVQAIADYVDQARAAVTVPVTYADVWEFWVRNRSLASKVSFAMIHILPYWEDEPVAIDKAVPHVLNIVRHVREVMPGVSLMVGETGWPSQGRARHGAVPSLVNQARFAREFAIEAPKLGVPYNFIEGFDQPWKRRLEGAMGGYWGLLDSDGVEKFPIRGPVTEDPKWLRGWWAGALAALAAALIAGLAKVRPAGVGLFALAGASAGAIGAAQVTYMSTWNRDAIEWGVTSFYSALALALWTLAAWRVVREPSLESSSEHGSANSNGLLAARFLAGLRLLILFGAAVLMALLVFDARYRGFPWPLYCLPGAAFLLLCTRPIRFWIDGLEERFLASLIVLFGLIVLALERPDNWHSTAFVLLSIALAGLAVRGNFGWLSAAAR